MTTGPDNWFFVFVIEFPFSTTTMQAQHPRKDYDTAWKEGAELVRKFAERGMRVTLSVRDTRKKSFDFSFNQLDS